MTYAAEVRGVDFPSEAVLKPLGLMDVGGGGGERRVVRPDPTVGRPRADALPAAKINERASVLKGARGRRHRGVDAGDVAARDAALGRAARRRLLPRRPPRAVRADDVCALRARASGAPDILAVGGAPAPLVQTGRALLPGDAFRLRGDAPPHRRPHRKALAATEWYAPENAPCFVYFDSLDDPEGEAAARRRPWEGGKRTSARRRATRTLQARADDRSEPVREAAA